LASEAKGRGFDPRQPHQKKKATSGVAFFFGRRITTANKGDKGCIQQKHMRKPRPLQPPPAKSIPKSSLRMVFQPSWQKGRKQMEKGPTGSHEPEPPNSSQRARPP
jgi:hypothetical protein